MKYPTYSYTYLQFFAGSIKSILISFLVVSALIHAQSQVTQKDSLALVDLYHATNGNNWDNNTRWLDATRPVAHWYGVFIDDGRVERLALDYNLMSGQLPESIGDLDYLEELKLYWNQITGPVPASIGNLVRLKVLRLGQNDFTEIPNEISNLFLLTKLDLDGNLLEWLPFRIGDLYQLRILTVNENKLTELSETLTLLFALERLELNKNNLQELPDDIGNLSSLKYLLVNKNQLTSLPASLIECTELEQLEADGNQLTSIPIGLGDLPYLNRVNLNRNQLTFRHLEQFGRRTDLFLFTYYGQENNIKLKMEDVSGTKRYVFPVGGDSTDYQWYLDGELILQSKDSFFIPDGVVAGEANLSCVATNKYLPGLSFESDSIPVSGSLVINSVRDLPLDPEAPTGTCSTGEMIVVDGKMIPECTMRAAFEMVNKQASNERTSFVINLQNGEKIVPQTKLPVLKHAIGLRTSDKVTLDGTILTLSEKKSTGIVFNAYEETKGIIVEGLRFVDFDVAIDIFESVDGIIRECSFNENNVPIVISESNGYQISKNSMTGGNMGILLFEVEHMVIQNNEFAVDSIGMYLNVSDFNTIKDNRIHTSHKGSGILIREGIYNKIVGNSIYNNSTGCLIEKQLNDIRKNSIQGNYFYNNATNLYLLNQRRDYQEQQHIEVKGNHIGVSELGIPATLDSFGIRVQHVGGVRIENNIISFQKECAIDLRNAHKSTIISNVIGGESVLAWNEKDGISASGFQELTIQNNVIAGNRGTGINGGNLHGKISGNYIGTNRNRDVLIPNGRDGILLEYFKGTIEHNWIYGNQGHGIQIHSGDFRIQDNDIGKSGFSNFGNKLDGVHINIGKDYFTGPDRAIIESNRIEDNEHGIYARSTNDEFPLMIIASNTIRNNTEGIYINDFKSSILSNTVEYNYDSGIKISGQPSGDPYLIGNNNIHGNGGGTGIHLTHADAWIQNNMITADETDGVLAEGSCKVNIYRNNIHKNQGLGVNNQDNDQIIKATRNWWGSSDGPGGSGSGAGDQVTTGILFAPWSSAQIGVCVASNSNGGLVPAGEQDSIQVFYQNWNDPMSMLQVEVIDELGWIQNRSGAYTVTLEDSLGFTEVLYVNIPEETELLNHVMIIASSALDETDRDTLILAMTSTNRAPSYLVLSPDSTQIDPGDSLRLTVNAYDQFFEDTTISYSWDVTGGFITEENVFVAGEVVGSYRLIAFNTEYALFDTISVFIGDVSTSIEDLPIDISDQMKFEIRPNPSRGQFILEYKSSEPSAVKVQILDLLGRLIMERDYGYLNINGSAIIPVSLIRHPDHPNPQIYLVKLITEEGHGIKKILVQ